MSMDFSRLEDLSHILNSRSDELNESLKAFEAKLASLRLGVTAWVIPALDRFTDEHGIEHRTKLGYSKATGNWCLTLSYESDIDREPEGGFIALSQAQRDLRLKAVKLLPDLLKAVEAAAEAAVTEVELARKRMREIVGEAKRGA